MKKTSSALRWLAAFLMAPLFLSSSMAFEGLILKKFSGQLENGNGHLIGQEMSYDGGNLKFHTKGAEIPIKKLEGTFEAQYFDLLASYNFGRESFLGGIEGFQTQNLNVAYEASKRLEVENNGLFIAHSGGQQYLPQLSLRCKKNTTPEKSLVEDLLSPCLDTGLLNIPTLEFDSLSGSSVSKALGGNKGLDKLEDISLTIYKGHFNLLFKARFLFRFKIKGHGSIQHLKEEGKIDVHLDSLKVGIFSLKGRILKEIREANLESFKVEGDHILISL